MLVVAWPLRNFNPDAKKGNSVSMVPFMLSTLYLASWFNVYSFKFSIKTNLFLFFLQVVFPLFFALIYLI